MIPSFHSIHHSSVLHYQQLAALTELRLEETKSPELNLSVSTASNPSANFETINLDIYDGR